MPKQSLVQTWLTAIGLAPHILETFDAAGIVNPKDLAELEVCHYPALGVQEPSDRKKLFYLVQRVKLAVPEDDQNEEEDGDDGDDDDDDDDDNEGVEEEWNDFGIGFGIGQQAGERTSDATDEQQQQQQQHGSNNNLSQIDTKLHSPNHIINNSNKSDDEYTAQFETDPDDEEDDGIDEVLQEQYRPLLSGSSSIEEIFSRSDDDDNDDYHDHDSEEDETSDEEVPSPPSQPEVDDIGDENGIESKLSFRNKREEAFLTRRNSRLKSLSPKKKRILKRSSSSTSSKSNLSANSNNNNNSKMTKTVSVRMKANKSISSSNIQKSTTTSTNNSNSNNNSLRKSSSKDSSSALSFNRRSFSKRNNLMNVPKSKKVTSSSSVLTTNTMATDPSTEGGTTSAVSTSVPPKTKITLKTSRRTTRKSNFPKSSKSVSSSLSNDNTSIDSNPSPRNNIPTYTTTTTNNTRKARGGGVGSSSYRMSTSSSKDDSSNDGIVSRRTSKRLIEQRAKELIHSNSNTSNNTSNNKVSTTMTTLFTNLEDQDSIDTRKSTTSSSSRLPPSSKQQPTFPSTTTTTTSFMDDHEFTSSALDENGFPISPDSASDSSSFSMSKSTKQTKNSRKKLPSNKRLSTIPSGPSGRTIPSSSDDNSLLEIRAKSNPKPHPNVSKVERDLSTSMSNLDLDLNVTKKSDSFDNYKNSSSRSNNNHGMESNNNSNGNSNSNGQRRKAAKPNASYVMNSGGAGFGTSSALGTGGGLNSNTNNTGGMVFVHGKRKKETWTHRVDTMREANDQLYQDQLKVGNLDNEYEEEMRIRVVVRKRPMSRKEAAQDDDADVIHPMQYNDYGRVLVYQPKTRVDLTREVETLPFAFDNVFEQDANNCHIYDDTIKNLIPGVFEGRWASVFAYGQTGSGKTFTMMGSTLTGIKARNRNVRHDQNYGLYLLAAHDLFDFAGKKEYSHFTIGASLFEIYGGKLFDLLNERNQVKCLENHQGRVCFPGLSEHAISNAEGLMKLIEKGSSNRSTGSTSANRDSSRSHAVLQLHLRKTVGSKANIEHGRLTFIDLAGSERGADTDKASRTTRLEGAEINTSLLALKEVIRALATGDAMGHIPFRGSKLTQVLKESFVGKNSRTVMVACVAPNLTNCDHTLNTLRYADRVKERNSETGELTAAIAAASKIQKKVQSSANRPVSAPPAGTDASRAYSQASLAKIDVTGDGTDDMDDWLSDLDGGDDDFDDDDIMKVSMDELNEVLKTPVHESASSFTFGSDDNIEEIEKGIGNWKHSPQKTKKVSKKEAAAPLITSHRSIMSEMLGMVKQEMTLVNCTDEDRALIDEYLDELEQIQDRQLSMISTLRESLVEYYGRRPTVDENEDSFETLLSS